MHSFSPFSNHILFASDLYIKHKVAAERVPQYQLSQCVVLLDRLRLSRRRGNLGVRIRFAGEEGHLVAPKNQRGAPLGHQDRIAVGLQEGLWNST